jgi:hypothetical protein
MQTITTIGLDIAKSVFQVHGVGVGPVLATALVAAVADPKSFRSTPRRGAHIGGS